MPRSQRASPPPPPFPAQATALPESGDASVSASANASTSVSGHHLPIWRHLRRSPATAPLSVALASALICMLLCWLPVSATEWKSLQAAGVRLQQGTLPIRPGTR